jgi:outer membrane protein assembly factor BamA
VEREGDSNGLLPASERLSAGGPDLVRGFALQLGPYIRRPVVDQATKNFLGYEYDPIGGDRRVILKTELRYRVTPLLGISTFLDNGNAFLSGEQLENYENRLRITNETAPPGTGSAVIEENIGYDLADLATKPGYLISRNYFAYGLAGNLLSPIGAINLAYAWPLKEPKSERCQQDSSVCLSRMKGGKQMYYRGRFELSVGAKF